MNVHENFIKKANKEISKLTADIEKKKARIAKLREEIKIHEAERERDSQFSDQLIKLMNDNGVNSDSDRKELLSKFEDLLLGEIENSEKEQSRDMENNQKSPTTENPVSQNSTYQYKSADSENQ